MVSARYTQNRYVGVPRQVNSVTNFTKGEARLKQANNGFTIQSTPMFDLVLFDVRSVIYLFDLVAYIAPNPFPNCTGFCSHKHDHEGLCHCWKYSKFHEVRFTQYLGKTEYMRLFMLCNKNKLTQGLFRVFIDLHIETLLKTDLF